MSREISKISLIIGTAGHIDHGKTSLIKALTSIDTDRLKEEKRRGLTIELGFAYIDFKDNETSYRAAIVDVPGHERFIKNMLTGATGMDLVLFTVAADDGIMPQTIEHLDIIRLLGIEDVFFIITKCDLVGKARVDAVAGDILSYVSGTPFEGAPLFKVSVKTNEGMKPLRRALVGKLLFMQESKGQRGGASQSYFRMPVDRSFTIKGFGTVVTGTVAAGSLIKGASILAYPSGYSLKVRGMESMHMAADSVNAGERAAVNLAGVARKDLKRGSCLMAPELEPFLKMSPVVECAFSFTGKKDLMKKTSSLFRDRGLIKVHHHTGEALARIRFAGRKTVQPGESARGRLTLRRPLLMMAGDHFILRDPSLNTTVGGGEVIFSYADKDLVPGFKSLAHSSEKADGQGEGIVNDLLMLMGPARPGLGFKTLSLLLNVRRDMVEARITHMLRGEDKSFYIGGGFLISSRYGALVKDAIEKTLRSYHELHPLEDGLTDEDLIGFYISAQKDRKSAESMRSLYRFIISEIVSEGLILRSRGKLSLKDFTSGLSESQKKTASKIKKLLHAKGLGLTKMEELKALGCRAEDIDGIVSYMKKNGLIISIKRGIFIDGEVLQGARNSCAKFITDNGGITAAQCRDILGCGRKLAILILEYFDTQGITVRSGDIRTLS